MKISIKCISIALLHLLSFYFIINCNGKKPEKDEGATADEVYFGGEDGKWPMTLENEFLFNPSTIESASSLESEEGGVIVMNSPKKSGTVFQYYLKLFQKKSWKILLNTFRPSDGKEMMDMNPELAKKAGLDSGDSRLPGLNYLLIAEGKLATFNEQSIITVSILSDLNNSTIRFYYKKIPTGVIKFDMQ